MLSSRKTQHGGFTLIEALVALLVLAIGLLGVAAMQLKALQGAHAAYQRSIASLAAQDAQERLWAQLAVKTDDASGTITCPTGSDASTIQNAWHDDWGEHGGWGEYLPGFNTGSTVSPVTGSSDCEFDIDVVWNEGRFGGSQETFSYIVRLPEE